MSPLDHAALADALLPAVLEAAAVQLKYHGTKVAIERKADRSPVTAADRESEAILIAALSAVMPGVPVVAEEAASQGNIPGLGPEFFLVDPLDGTREFISGSDEFTINIGLVVAGTPRFGIVFAPAKGQMFATIGPDQVVEARVAPGTRARAIAELAPTGVRTRRPDATALTAISSRWHRRAEVDAFLARFRVSERRYVGSSLKFCLLARGDADLYPRFGSINEWDTAAGHAVVVAAGGLVTTLDGAPLLYGRVDHGFRHPDFVAWGSAALLE